MKNSKSRGDNTIGIIEVGKDMETEREGRQKLTRIEKLWKELDLFEPKVRFEGEWK